MENKKSLETIGPYEVLTSEVKYQNRWITVREDAVVRPGEVRGIFGVVEMVPGSLVVVLDDHQNVFLVREFKYGIRRDSLELISGGLEVNESPLEGAKRELKEELGLVAEEWTDLGMVDPFTTVVRSPNYMFLARKLREGKANPDEGEELWVVKLPFEKVLALVFNGEITHSASCVAILRTARVLAK